MSQAIVRGKVVEVSYVVKGSMAVTDRVITAPTDSVDITIEGPRCAAMTFRVAADAESARSFSIGANVKVTFERDYDRDSEDEDDR